MRRLVWWILPVAIAHARGDFVLLDPEDSKPLFKDVKVSVTWIQLPTARNPCGLPPLASLSPLESDARGAQRLAAFAASQRR